MNKDDLDGIWLEVSKMEKRFVAADAILFAIYILSILLPFLLVNYGWEVSRDVSINPTLINGLISLSGLLFGFTTATTVLRRAPKIIYVMLFINLILFYYVAKELFEATVKQQPLLSATTWAMASLLSNFTTAGALLALGLMLRIKRINIENTI